MYTVMYYLFAVLQAALRCTAVLSDAVRSSRDAQAASLLSPSEWLTRHSSCYRAHVSFDTTAHACRIIILFGAGLLHIALCSSNS
jgi:hypothetical protein